MTETNDYLSRLKPGYWLMILTCWWPLLFFLVAIGKYPLIEYLSSYYLYFIIFGVSIITGLLINLVEKRFSFWNRIGHWRKYLIVCIAYTLNMAVIFTVAGFLQSKNILDFFGGDPEGSIGMLFMPSIFVYFILGAIFGLAVTALNKL